MVEPTGVDAPIVTQIGSVPFTDVDRAIDYSMRHEIPFLPELTARGDGMLQYAKRPGRLAALAAFKRNRFTTVKVQSVGPATLITSGYSEDDAVAAVYRHLEAIFDGLIAEATILFLDEPALGTVGFDYERLWQPLLETFPAIHGVHTCGNMQWDLLAAAPIDMISFDASRYEITSYLGSDRSVRIAWGALEKKDVRDYRPGDLITGPCGMPHTTYSPSDAERRLESLTKLADQFRQQPRR
ncbi:MAG: hypothetical protein JSW65_04350 [Candidatus Bipolaricaulota bacterium]|nr:MAG: hypothetical protein JSW65_04350 [Candidatus Bipolaricaulota bacterium]